MTPLRLGFLLFLASMFSGGCSSAKLYSMAPPSEAAVSRHSTLGFSVASPGEAAPAGPGMSSPDSAGAVAVASGVTLPTQTGHAQLAADADTATPAGGRVLIYVAELQVSAADVEAALSAAQKLCEESGGYMDLLRTDSIRIRVPAKRFHEVLEQIKGIGQVLSRNISAQDVTDEYADLQLRLKNAQALRDRFLAILEKAQNIKDTLDIERELGRVREEIERLEGRLAAMEKQIAFSTIVINFVKPAQAQVQRRMPPAPFAWLDSLGVEQLLRLGR